MLPIFEKIKNKARELDIDDGDIQDIFVNDYSDRVRQLDQDCRLRHINNKKFKEFLNQLEYKWICRKSNIDTDYITAIIELEGQPYKLTYYVSSYDDDEIDDIWDWKPAVKKQVITTVYE